MRRAYLLIAKSRKRSSNTSQNERVSKGAKQRTNVCSVENKYLGFQEWLPKQIPIETIGDQRAGEQVCSCAPGSTDQ